MELYYLIGLIIIALCIILCYYIHLKPLPLKKQIKIEKFTPEPVKEIDEKAFIRNITEEDAIKYFQNSIYHEMELGQESAKSFLMARCSKYWPEKFPYNN